MLYKPLIGDQQSGSIGGITASHNRGGTYFRQRAIPVNPNTIFQQAVRGFMATLTSLWTDTLTPAERAAWDLYALNVLIPNRLGDPRNIGGLGQYIRSNVPRLQVGLARVDAAPIIFDLGPFTNPTFDTFVAISDVFNVNFTGGDDWVTEDGAAMLISSSRSTNPTINFFQGPYRAVAPILGDSGAPPASPVVTLAAFNIAVGNRTFIQIRVSRADGRLTLPFRGFGLGA